MILPIIGLALAVLTAVIIPVILWGSKLDAALTTIKENHLKHIEHNTQQTNERLIEIATILRERQ